MNKTINIHAFYWLLGTLIFVCLPHYSHLPAWSLAFIAITLLLKTKALHKGQLRIHKLVIIMMTIGAVGGILIEYSQLFGRNAGITLLVVMLFLKLLETQTYRDGMLLACIMCFLIITNFLFEQRILMAAYMFFGVIGVTHSFIKLNELQNLNKIELPVYATKITLFSIPCMVIFFFVFPRIPGPLWELPVDKSSAKTGLSDTMTFGNIGSLALSNEPAFRVEFNGSAPSQRDLYWRGIVLENFDGETWSENNSNKPAPKYKTSGPNYEYTITLEPHNKKWMFILEMPTSVSDLSGTQYNERFQLLNKEEINQLKRYSLTSSINYSIDAKPNLHSLTLNLHIPANTNPRTEQFAKQLRASSKNTTDFIQKALNFFRQEEFYYTLRPKILSGDKIDQFLFSTRKGFCEHYASSFVFMMRAAGIPARVVTGYQGGEMNALSNYMIVKQADAHAWAEVWIAEQGWRRVDPTAAISPERIEQNIDDALDNAENPRFTLPYNNKTLQSLRFILDSVNHNWNQWVIAYDQQKQATLFNKIGLQYQASNAIIILTILVLSIFIIAYYFIIKNKNIKKTTEKHQKIYQQFVLLLEKQNLPKINHENALQFSQRAIKKFPYLKNQIIQITHLYNSIEYNDKGDINLINNLQSEIEKITKILKNS